eukprot:CAMPEP_0170198932 /NCGR_PEP_ID=MMETSP0040_2-20121228/69061_1 /TAXON_ID=641309 /ORGANISM="Lotharella oceanica, Strain CCMP622" /LENGTH=81 /DNA_ID=CAMNT_0010449001 /DNA_START=646 /DNA_END=891 /DNA_ORIENTATION=-
MTDGETDTSPIKLFKNSEPPPLDDACAEGVPADVHHEEGVASVVFLDWQVNQKEDGTNYTTLSVARDAIVQTAAAGGGTGK